jgi:hypothetical protein
MPDSIGAVVARFRDTKCGAGRAAAMVQRDTIVIASDRNVIPACRRSTNKWNQINPTALRNGLCPQT